MNKDLYDEINALLKTLLSEKIVFKDKNTSKIRQRALRFLKRKNIIVLNKQKTAYQPTTEILEVRKIGLTKYLKDTNHELKFLSEEKTLFGINYNYFIYFSFFLLGFLLNWGIKKISKLNKSKQQIQRYQTEPTSGINLFNIYKDQIKEQNETILSLKKEIIRLQKKEKQE